MPKSRISSGVISEPPPTPVNPTMAPTTKPDRLYKGSMPHTMFDTPAPAPPSARRKVEAVGWWRQRGLWVEFGVGDVGWGNSFCGVAGSWLDGIGRVAPPFRPVGHLPPQAGEGPVARSCHREGSNRRKAL